jgi:hypothetical protein
MYPWFLWHEGLAEIVARREAKSSLGYVGLERFALYNLFALARLKRRRPPLVCLNDNFGARASPRAVAVVRRFLEAEFPIPSRFERASEPAREAGASHLQPPALG